MPVDFQAVDEYNKYQWRIVGFHSSTYIKFTSIDAKLSANKKKSYNQYKEWAIPIGVAHFKNKQKYKSEFGDWINLVFVVKTFILGRCYGK